jgi:hypothetical protein
MGLRGRRGLGFLWSAEEKVIYDGDDFASAEVIVGYR